MQQSPLGPALMLESGRQLESDTAVFWPARTASKASRPGSPMTGSKCALSFLDDKVLHSCPMSLSPSFLSATCDRDPVPQENAAEPGASTQAVQTPVFPLITLKVVFLHAPAHDAISVRAALHWQAVYPLSLPCSLLPPLSSSDTP